MEECQKRIDEIRTGGSAEKLLAKAEKLNIDSNIETIVVADSTKMISNYYCLAQFNGLVLEKDPEVEIFAYAIKGLSFGKESEKNILNGLHRRRVRTKITTHSLCRLTTMSGYMRCFLS